MRRSRRPRADQCSAGSKCTRNGPISAASPQSNARASILGIHAAQDCVVAERREDRAGAAAREPRERAKIHVVEMVVRDEDRVQRRQGAERNRGGDVAPRPDAAPGSRAPRPDRVEQQIDALGLDEKAGMADEADAQLMAVNAFGRMIVHDGRKVFRPRHALSRLARPARDVAQVLVLRPAGRKEAQAVEMIGRRTGIIGIAGHRRYRRRPIK